MHLWTWLTSCTINYVYWRQKEIYIHHGTIHASYKIIEYIYMIHVFTWLIHFSSNYWHLLLWKVKNFAPNPNPHSPNSRKKTMSKGQKRFIVQGRGRREDQPRIEENRMRRLPLFLLYPNPFPQFVKHPPSKFKW